MFVNSLVVPKSSQIANYLYNTYKPKHEGERTFDYAELHQLLEANAIVPEFDHEPFVITSTIKIDSISKWLIQTR